MRGFYQKLDTELAKNSYHKKDIETNPVAVGGDAAYLVIRQRLGGSRMQEMLNECRKEFNKISKKYLNKNIDSNNSRFNEKGRPEFSDADLYLPNPYNYMQLDMSLKNMGYETSLKKAVESNGRTVYNHKDGDPSKVEVFVKTKASHNRPNSKLTIETMLPYYGMSEGCLAGLNGIKNIDFIEPKCFSDRLVNDLAASDKSPIKLIEDIRVIHRYLSSTGDAKI